MYLLPAERVEISVDKLTAEVAKILSESVYLTAVSLMAAAVTAPTLERRRDLYGFFVLEAQPTWAIFDHRGPVHPTAAGCLRLPDAIGFRLVEAWIDDFTAQPPATAADEILPPGPVRNAVNAKLRKR